MALASEEFKRYAHAGAPFVALLLASASIFVDLATSGQHPLWLDITKWGLLIVSLAVFFLSELEERVAGFLRDRVELAPAPPAAPQPLAAKALLQRPGSTEWAQTDPGLNEALSSGSLQVVARFDRKGSLSHPRLRRRLRAAGLWTRRPWVQWAWALAATGHAALSPWDSPKLRLVTEPSLPSGPGRRLDLAFGRTRYRASVLTNHQAAVEAVWRGKGGSRIPRASGLRSFWQEDTPLGPGLRPLDESGLANTVGISVLLVTADDHVLLPLQRSNNNLSKKTLAPSGSGGLDWPAKWRWPWARRPFDLAEFLQAEALREAAEECALGPDDLADLVQDFRLLGFARIGQWGGHPEFLAVAALGCTLESLKDMVAGGRGHAVQERPFTRYVAYGRLPFQRDGTPDGWTADRLPRLAWLVGPSPALGEVPVPTALSYPLRLALALWVDDERRRTVAQAASALGRGRAGGRGRRAP